MPSQYVAQTVNWTYLPYKDIRYWRNSCVCVLSTTISSQSQHSNWIWGHEVRVVVDTVIQFVLCKKKKNLKILMNTVQKSHVQVLYSRFFLMLAKRILWRCSRWLRTSTPCQNSFWLRGHNNENADTGVKLWILITDVKGIVRLNKAHNSDNFNTLI